MLSIITPLHEKYEKYIYDCYNSFKDQKDWEWIIVENHGGKVPDSIKKDASVHVVQAEDDGVCSNIGRLKSIAAKSSKGDVIVELDADDMLTPGSLDSIRGAFIDPSISMVYSNSAHFDEHWKGSGYSGYYGWKQRPFFHNNHELIEMIAFPCNAQMMRRIEWAPNHVRAWRKAAYDKIGGHNPEIAFGDDHDLCCRFFIEYGPKSIKHIDKCLYLYRTHSENSCNIYNQDVQSQTYINYLKYSRQMAIKQAESDGTRLLDLGGRINSWPDFETVDLVDANVIADLNCKWPFDDNSVGVIRASHIFEHLKSPIHTMNEAYRVLAPGGWLFLEVPSTDGRGAFQDPTHISFWNSNSIWYYTDRDYSRFIPGYNGKFQVANSVTWYPTAFEKTHDIKILQSDLIAIKGQRFSGEVKI